MRELSQKWWHWSVILWGIAFQAQHDTFVDHIVPQQDWRLFLNWPWFWCQWSGRATWWQGQIACKTQSEVWGAGRPDDYLEKLQVRLNRQIVMLDEQLDDSPSSSTLQKHSSWGLSNWQMTHSNQQIHRYYHSITIKVSMEKKRKTRSKDQWNATQAWAISRGLLSNVQCATTIEYIFTEDNFWVFMDDSWGEFSILRWEVN